MEPRTVASLLLIITLRLGGCQSQAGQGQEYPFPNCPTTQLPLPTDPIPLQTVLGPWFTIRSVHPPGSPEVDCQSDTYWTNFGEQGNENNSEPVVHLLYTQRMAGVMQYHQAAVVSMKHFPGGLVHRNWTFNMFGLELPTMFVESDNGQTWSIWHTCADLPPPPGAADAETGAGYPIWVLMTREQKIDSKLEQELVEKMEAYSGYSQKKMREVGQANCFA